jgi:hypothetical protein
VSPKSLREPLIENFFGKLKEFKRIAMRCDKTGGSFEAMIYLATAVILVRARLGDGFADSRERRGVVECEAFALHLQSEIAPEGSEIGRYRLRAHLVVQVRQHIDANGLVRGRKHALDRPVPFVIAAVIVESAPQDRKRLPPNMVKPTDPAMKAKKPVCGENPPRRAVAICSGIAIAASVSPAIKSLGRNEASERKIGQA